MIQLAAGAKIAFHYKNWQGRDGVRTVLALYLWRGTTQWHKDDQWFLHAYDPSIGKIREFALNDMTNVSFA